jgi:hypothetical protein
MSHLSDFVSLRFGEDGVGGDYCDSGVPGRRTFGLGWEYDGTFSLLAELRFDFQTDLPGAPRGGINHQTI